MRIAMVGPFGFHPNKSMRSRAFGLARPLVKRGHQLRLIMPPWQTPEEADTSWEEEGVEIRYTSLKGGPPGIALRLLRETLHWGPDVVHCFKPKAYSGLVMWWLWQFHRNRLRLILDSDDWEGWGGWNDQARYPRWQKRIFSWQERWGYRHCHALTLASRTLQSLAWSLGVPQHQVWYVPNGPGIDGNRPGVDGKMPGIDAKMPPDPNQNSGGRESIRTRLNGRATVLWYSRLFESDPGRLVRILERVRNELPDVAVLMVGSGLYQEDTAAFRRAMEQTGLDEAIVDVGWVEQEQLPGILSLADAGLYLMDDTLLNRTKCPVKLADMLSLGIPVVAEAVGQVPEYVIHGESGRLRQSGDEEGLAVELVEILQNPEERKRLANGAKRHIETVFSWQQLSEVVEQAYLGNSS